MYSPFSNVIRLWSTEKWDCENWTTAGGRVSAGAWSHDGVFLVFATSSLPYFYSVRLSKGLYSSEPPSAYIVADLTKVQVPGTEDV